jgi:hypothetical protein
LWLLDNTDSESEIVMRAIIITLEIVAICGFAVSTAPAGELMYGCVSRPACGKVCKLVCETKKIPGVGYGYECDTICIPHCSRVGCKHCDTTCCPQDDIEGCPPRIEFCWYDWFACGCAKPRSIKLLTKYQAEREVCSYRWEVVDAACCDFTTQGAGAPKNPTVYKPAPVEAAVGDVLAVTDAEWKELETVLTSPEQVKPLQIAEQPAPTPTTPTAPPEGINVAEKLQGLFRK